MKKVLMICVLAVLSSHAHATTMCAANNALTVVLDPYVEGSAHFAKLDLSEWSVMFSYGTMFGSWACVGTPGGSVPETLIDDETGKIVTGGEQTGKYCWCQITHPLKSRWVFLSTAQSADECKAKGCPCSHYIRYDSVYRKQLFGSVGNQ